MLELALSKCEGIRCKMCKRYYALFFPDIYESFFPLTEFWRFFEMRKHLYNPPLSSLYLSLTLVRATHVKVSLQGFPYYISCWAVYMTLIMDHPVGVTSSRGCWTLWMVTPLAFSTSAPSSGLSSTCLLTGGTYLLGETSLLTMIALLVNWKTTCLLIGEICLLLDEKCQLTGSCWQVNHTYWRARYAFWQVGHAYWSIREAF